MAAERRPTGPAQPVGNWKRRPARLILNIDHVYSTQRDSLVITISTTGQHGPLASSIVPGPRGSRLPRPLPVPSHPVPSDWSSPGRLASWSVVQPGSHCITAPLAGSFVISSNGFRSFVRRRRRVEFDESLKLTDARPSSRRSGAVCQPTSPPLFRSSNQPTVLLHSHLSNADTTDNSPDNRHVFTRATLCNAWRGLCDSDVSVHLSVCPSYASIVSKRRELSS